MTVVRITIKKKLIEAEGVYSYRQSAANEFSSEYLVRTEAPLPSSQFETYAINIARAESRLFPSSVSFEGANVKLATPGHSGEALRGQFSQISLPKLRGQLILEAEDALPFPPVAAVYVRQAQRGRNGRLLIPYALTAAEWHLYHQKQVRPFRFQTPNPPHSTSELSFSQELLEAVRGSNGTYVMPGVACEREDLLRQVTNFVFTGFFVGSTKSKRKRPGPAAKRAAEFRDRLRNLTGEVTDSANAAGVAPNGKGTKGKAVREGVVYLLQGGEYFKIGKSIDFEKRLGQIKLQLPYPVELVHVIRAANPGEAEAHWHRRFAALRRNGEWFVLSQAEVDEFKSVSEM